MRLVHLKPENQFLPDLAELAAAAKGAKLIALTNPIYIQHPLTTQSLLPE